MQSYKKLISEKDQKLAEFKSKLESASVDQREQELFKQIADYKEKNNVSRNDRVATNWKWSHAHGQGLVRHA